VDSTVVVLGACHQSQQREYGAVTTGDNLRCNSRWEQEPLRLIRVGLFRRRSTNQPATSYDLRLADDVAGLSRALSDNSPAVVRQAAEALGQIHRSAGEPASGEAARTGRYLLATLTRMITRADVPVDA